ncbi:Zn-ribbon domain-containing OB-fold protein [Thermodesulfobacteriota bacterium]
MNDHWRQETQPLVLEGGIHMPYSWTVGRIGSRFLIELRDHGRVMANRCQKCSVGWVPPRQRCPVCFEEISDDDWFEAGPEGTLRHFTIVRYEHPGQPVKPPFAYGLIDLDGAGSAIAHLVSGVNLDELKSGMRVKPVLRKDREGAILDIEYFQPIIEE